MPRRVELFDKVMTLVEDAVYAVIALVLSIASIGLLWVAAHDTVTSFGELETEGALHVLDTLLLVFIFVELLFAVRETVRERQVLVEPFLLVGMHAAHKVSVVLSLEAAAPVTKDPAAIDRSITEIGVLGLLLVALAASAVLLRRKEREPSET